MYAVVKFLEEEGALGLVCTNWILSNDICYYPNVKTNKAKNNLLRQRTDPKHDWQYCKIKILHRYKSLSLACQHLSRAEETSNLESESESILQQPCKKTKKIHVYPGEESDEETPSTSKNISVGSPIPCPAAQKDSPTTLVSPPSPFPIPVSTSCCCQSVSSPQDITPECERPSQDQAIINENVISWMTGISERIQDLDKKLNIILENQTNLMNSKTIELAENFGDLSVLGDLPVKDDESFLLLNKGISEKKHLRQILINVLVSIGGKDMRSHIHNMMKRIMSDEVAEKYSLSGKTYSKDVVKKSFIATDVSRTILFVCQRVYKQMATEGKVKEAVSDWLSQAKCRKVRRILRQEKRMETNEVLSDEDVKMF